VALDASTQDSLAKLTASLKERATGGENLASTYIMWAFFTAVTMIGAIAVCFTPQADRRFTEAMVVPSRTVEAPPQMVARAETPPPAPAPVIREEPDAELLARLKLLEEQLDNVTGSIAKLPPPAPPAPPPPSGVTPQSSEAPKQVKTAPVAPVAAAPAPEPQEMVVQIPAPAPAAAAPVQAKEAGEPAVTASIPTSFGLDLGSETSFGALRARWDTLKREHPELARLSPRISVRDSKGRVELRLIAGPFTNASDAARVCASLFVKGVSCDGGLFDGQRLPAS
jgi:hypothetical protein